MRSLSTRAWFTFFALLAVINTMRFVHLDADFPQGVTTSRALYTDEGLYSLNAVSIGTGRPWYTPREFNAIIDLPVVPILQSGVFRIFGPSLVAARSLVAAMSIVLIAAACGLTAIGASLTCAALVAVTLSLDFLLFSYSRLAIFDLIMSTIVTLSFVAASSFRERRGVLASVVAGTLLGVAALAKTTAICGLPALAYLCSTRAVDVRRKWKLAGLASAVCASVVVGYTALVWHVLPEGYARFYEVIDGRLPLRPIDPAKNLALAVFNMVRFDPGVTLVAFGSAAALLKASAAFRGSILVRTSGLWVLTFLAMLSLSSYQPSRYFVVVLVPLVIVSSVGLVQLGDLIPNRRTLTTTRAVIIGCLLGYNAVRIADYLLHPTYTFQRMAREVGEIVRSEPGQGPTVLIGDMAPSVSLENGVKAISLNSGTQDLATRVAADCPTHLIALEAPTEDEARVLSSYYVVEPIREWNVFDNYYEHEPVRLSRLRPRTGLLPSCPLSP